MMIMPAPRILSTAALLIAALPGHAQAQPANYEIHPAQGARIGMEIFKTGLLSGKKHQIEFTRYTGTLRYDAASPAASTVELSIETPSIIVLDQWLKLDDQKKVKAQAVGNEGLDIAKFPTMRFVSSSIAPATAEKFTVRGELTIRGIARPSTLDVTLQTQPGGALTISGATVVKMTDYGIKPPKAALGAVGTKDEMPIAFTVIATRK